MNLPEISIKRPVFITCVVILMLVLGLMSMSKMSVDLFPDVTFPAIFVQTVYPGASPQDIEKQVSKPIEEELGSLSGLDKMYSQNADSISFVIMNFKIGTDIKDAEQQIRQRLGNIRNQLPKDVKEPVVRRFDPADQPVAQVAVTGDLPPDQLYDLVDQKLKSQFETVPGVGLVNILGGRKKEIQVLVSRQKLQERQLSLLQVADKISKTSQDVPVGKLDDSQKSVSVRASGEFDSLESIKEVAVNFFGSDNPVALRQIAEIKEGLRDEESHFVFRSKQDSYQPRPAISMNIYKQSGSNTVRIVDLVKARIEKVNESIQKTNPEVKLSLIRETAKPIRMNIKDVQESILIGIVLCVIVVFFFLGSWKSTFITGMALPNSLLGGFVIMYSAGFTINILTLLALSLAVGLLIDDAIVVRENIFRHIEMGKSPKQASLEGTKEVAMAVIATTLVVIAVFGPIAFLEGIIGQFFKQFGLTVVFTMLISLFDAFTVAPMLSTYMAAKADHVRSQGFVNSLLNSFDKFQTSLENSYEKLTKWVLVNPAKVLVSAVVIFVLSMILGRFLPKNFLPPADNGEFQVTLELPLGTSLAQTKEFSRQVEEAIVKNSAIELTSTVAGYTTQPKPNAATIYVRLTPRKERKGNTSDVKTQVREALKVFQDKAIIGVGDIDISGGNQKIFQLVFRASDLEQLSEYVEKVKPKIASIKGLADVDTNYRVGKPEVHIVFDRTKSEELGVSTVTAGAELRASLEGVTPAVFRSNGNEYDVRVRMREEDRNIRENFDKIKVPNANFNMIPLSRVAVNKDIKTYSQINRLNKGRYVMIDANLGPGGNLGNITQEVITLLNKDPEVKMPTGITYEFIGQAEDFRILIENMLMAMGLGVLLIYLVLASLYNSFITPFTILLALPLAMTGAFGGLFLTGKAIDLFSMIGIVMLLGVVAKNSILLVDYANKQIDEGVARNEAILKAARTRLRPILMTSFALIAGTIPIAIGLNEASAQRTSMGIAIIGGLISSTFLTLIVVPAAFGYVDDFRRWTGRWGFKDSV